MSSSDCMAMVGQRRRNGYLSGLKIRFPQGSVGSSPTLANIKQYNGLRDGSPVLTNGIDDRAADNLLTSVGSHGSGVAQQEQQWLPSRKETACGIAFSVIKENVTGSTSEMSSS